MELNVSSGPTESQSSSFDFDDNNASLSAQLIVFVVCERVGARRNTACRRQIPLVSSRLSTGNRIEEHLTGRSFPGRIFEAGSQRTVRACIYEAQRLAGHESDNEWQNLVS